MVSGEDLALFYWLQDVENCPGVAGLIGNLSTLYFFDKNAAVNRLKQTTALQYMRLEVHVQIYYSITFLSLFSASIFSMFNFKRADISR